MNSVIQSIKSLSSIILDDYPNINDGVCPEAIKRLMELINELDEKIHERYLIGKEDLEIISFFLSELKDIQKSQKVPNDDIDWLYFMVASIRERIIKGNYNMRNC